MTKSPDDPTNNEMKMKSLQYNECDKNRDLLSKGQATVEEWEEGESCPEQVDGASWPDALLCRCDSDRPRLVEGVASKSERDWRVGLFQCPKQTLSWSL